MATKPKKTASTPSGKLVKPSVLNDLGSMRRIRDRAFCNHERPAAKNRELIDCMTRAIAIVEEEIFVARVAAQKKAG